MKSLLISISLLAAASLSVSGAQSALPHALTIVDTLADLSTNRIPVRGETVLVRGLDTNTYFPAPVAYSHNPLAPVSATNYPQAIAAKSGTNGLWALNYKWTLAAAIAGVNETNVDNSAYLQTAVNAAKRYGHATDMYSNPIGGAIELPGGVIKLASPVVLGNGVKIKGAGRNITVVTPTGTNTTAFYCQAMNGGTNVPGQADFTISDIHFIGNGQSNVVFIVSTNMSNQLNIRDVKASYGSNLLSACSVEGAHIVNVEASNMQGKVLNFYSTSSQANVGVVLESIYVALSGGNFEIKDSYGLVINGAKCNSCDGPYRLDAAVAATLNGLEGEVYTSYALDMTNFNDTVTINSPYFRINSGTNTAINLRSYSKGITINNFHFVNNGGGTVNGIDDYGTSEYLKLAGYVDSGDIRAIPSWRNGSRWGLENTSGARAKYQTGQGGNIPDFGFSGRGTRRTGFATFWDEGNPSANIVYPMYQSESGTNSYWKVGLSKTFVYTNDFTTVKTAWVNQGSALLLVSNHVGATTIVLSTNLDSSTTSVRPLPGTTMSITDLGSTGASYAFAVQGNTNAVSSYGQMTQDWIWDGTNWVCQGVRFPMPPNDGYTYALRYGQWLALGIISDAPSDGNEYVRKDGAWSIATGGGGGATNATQVKINGSAYLPIANFTDDSEITWGVSGSTVTAILASASIGTNKLSAVALSYLKDRSTDTGTQLYSTISDADTNVWAKILSSIQPTNGVQLITNAGLNKLYVGAKLTNGANVTLSTNADGTLVITATTSGTSNGTPVNVNGGAVLSAANIRSSTNINVTVTGTNVDITVTNSGVTAGAYTSANITVGADGRIISAANGSSGGSGAGTNIFVNNVLSQPAKLTNSTTVTWSTNANGDIVANGATNFTQINVGSLVLTNPVPVSSGGTGGTNIPTALANLGIDTNSFAFRTLTNTFASSNVFQDTVYIRSTNTAPIVFHDASGPGNSDMAGFYSSGGELIGFTAGTNINSRVTWLQVTRNAGYDNPDSVAIGAGAISGVDLRGVVTNNTSIGSPILYVGSTNVASALAGKAPSSSPTLTTPTLANGVFNGSMTVQMTERQPHSSVTNFVADPTVAGYQLIYATNLVTKFLHLTNAATGLQTTFLVIAGTNTTVSVECPATLWACNTNKVSISAGQILPVAILCYGSNNTNVVAAMGQPMIR